MPKIKAITLTVCPYCFEAMKSHGERLHIIDHNYTESVPCDFCGEEDEETYTIKA